MTGRPLNVPQGPGGGVKGHTPIKSNSNQPPCSEDQISDILCSSVTMETTPRPHVSEGQGGDGGRPLRQPSPPKLRPKGPGGGLLGPAGSPSGGHATAAQRTTLAGRDKKEKNAPGTPGEDLSTAGEPEELSQSGVERGGGRAWLSPSPRWAERLVWESDNPRRWLLWRRVNAGCELRRGRPTETHVHAVNQRWCFQMCSCQQPSVFLGSRSLLSPPLKLGDVPSAVFVWCP